MKCHWLNQAHLDQGQRPAMSSVYEEQLAILDNALDRCKEAIEACPDEEDTDGVNHRVQLQIRLNKIEKSLAAAKEKGDFNLGVILMNIHGLTRDAVVSKHYWKDASKITRQGELFTDFQQDYRRFEVPEPQQLVHQQQHSAPSSLGEHGSSDLTTVSCFAGGLLLGMGVTWLVAKLVKGKKQTTILPVAMTPVTSVAGPALQDSSAPPSYQAGSYVGPSPAKN